MDQRQGPGPDTTVPFTSGVSVNWGPSWLLCHAWHACDFAVTSHLVLASVLWSVSHLTWLIAPMMRRVPLHVSGKHVKQMSAFGASQPGWLPSQPSELLSPDGCRGCLTCLGTNLLRQKSWGAKLIHVSTCLFDDALFHECSVARPVAGCLLVAWLLASSLE